MKLSNTLITVIVATAALLMGTNPASAATPPADATAKAFAKSPRTNAKPKTVSGTTSNRALSRYAGFKGTIYLNSRRMPYIVTYLQRWNGSQWVNVKAVNTNSAGSFSITGIAANGTYYRMATAYTVGKCAYGNVPYYLGASNFFQVKGGYTYTGTHSLYFYAYLAQGCAWFIR